MQHFHQINTSAFNLINMLEDSHAGCDPDFDARYDDLEREFAELRLQFGEE